MCIYSEYVYVSKLNNIHNTDDPLKRLWGSRLVLHAYVGFPPPPAIAPSLHLPLNTTISTRGLLDLAAIHYCSIRRLRNQYILCSLCSRHTHQSIYSTLCRRIHSSSPNFSLISFFHISHTCAHSVGFSVPFTLSDHVLTNVKLVSELSTCSFFKASVKNLYVFLHLLHLNRTQCVTCSIYFELMQSFSHIDKFQYVTQERD